MLPGLTHDSTNAIMFSEIFRFEIKYRLKKLDTYLFFLFFFLAVTLGFALSPPSGNRNSFVNSPAIITDMLVGSTTVMMLVSGVIMSGSLYRDIEFNVYESYLTFPISRNGYFWGRFLGSFLFVMIIGSSVIWGALAGPLIGLWLGWLGPNMVAPFHWVNYIQPFFCYVLPNMFVTSAIFFGLVAYTRNTRVIYAGAIVLFFGYGLAQHVLQDIPNKTWVYLLDPFAFNSVRLKVSFFSPEQHKSSLVRLEGWMLVNRVIWGSVGLIILLVTWLRFSFARFFSGKENGQKSTFEVEVRHATTASIPFASANFSRGYGLPVVLSLTKTELTNILRDNYFRIILLAAICGMALSFWSVGPIAFGVLDAPRTTRFLGNYDHNFFYLHFLIILFFTGEALHREKASRYAIINDSLPPTDRMFYGSKLLALLVLPFILSLLPILVGVGVQLGKGYSHFHLSMYLTYCLGILFPKCLELLMFVFAIHVLINNKFAGHAVAILIWWLLWLGNNGAAMNYNLLLYSFTPSYTFSEMGGIIPVTKPLFWFIVYWLFGGGLLLLLGSLLYPRGVTASFGERVRLARQRLGVPTKLVGTILLIGFLATGTYDYYKVSYQGTYLTQGEIIQRAVEYERRLKKYEDDPLPSIVRYRLYTDIFPAEQRAATRAEFTIVNRTLTPIRTLLLDGDELADYSMSINGKEMPVSYPLIYSRAAFSPFKSKADTSMYRIYSLPRPLLPGDTALLELKSTVELAGFANKWGSFEILRNGTFFSGGLPDLGYDENDELKDPQLRARFGLPKRRENLPLRTDSAGIHRLLITNLTGLASFEATISTSADQVAVTPGKLERSWVLNGRNYYHYVLDSPRNYFAFPVFSARYNILRDSVSLADGKKVGIDIYYHPEHEANLKRFLDGCKDGLRYYSDALGDYPFNEVRMLETVTGWQGSFPNSINFGENNGWTTWFTGPDQFDFCYFNTAFQLAQQWWVFQVPSNYTLGSQDIMEGLPKYGALMLYEKKMGKDKARGFLRDEMKYYLDKHHAAFGNENALIDSKNDFVSNTKAGLVLYAIRNFIGEDRLNLALKQFLHAYAYRDHPPYAGSGDLLRYIRKMVPDSLQYYLDDSWERITLYDNKVISATASAIGDGSYKVHLRVSIGKFYCDSAGMETVAKQVDDYVDIGIFGAGTRDKDGYTHTNELFLQRFKLTAGEHDFDITVKGKPFSVGIDPYGELIDRQPDDNTKNL
jgi:ABC-2 type transport system permease protein